MGKTHSSDNDLLDNELNGFSDCLDTDSQQQPGSYILPFDTRVQWFHSLSNSMLFNEKHVSSSDLHFWFPECSSEDTKKEYLAIPKELIQDSIECVLAELMEETF